MQRSFPWWIPVVAGAGWALSRAQRAGIASVSEGVGWSAATGVVMSPAMRAYADRLGRMVPWGWYITSGIRTPAAQARAWDGKIRPAEGVKPYSLADMLKLYKRDDLVRDAWSAGGGAPPTRAQLEKAFSAQVARGQFITSHMTGWAFDVRTTGGPGDHRLTGRQVDELRAAVSATGGRSVLERRPPHLHVEVPRG